MREKNVKILYHDVTDLANNIKDKLYTRDYYSISTYFRLFIQICYETL